jgi:hypothetical protein
MLHVETDNLQMNLNWYPILAIEFVVIHQKEDLIRSVFEKLSPILQEWEAIL